MSAKCRKNADFIITTLLEFMMEHIKITKDLPIGFMDSGLGGLSVLQQAVRIMPAEDFIYYGDSANAPYGTKPQEEIRRLTFDVVEKLLDMGIKGLAVACNTATSAAVRLLREKYTDLPIVGIEPAIKPAVEENHGGQIVVMATPMTIAQEKYHKLLDKYRGDKEIVSIPCAGLMEFVEEGDLNGDDLDKYFEEHLVPYLSDNLETIVLGCTHYPFVRPHLRAFLNNPSVNIIDGSVGTSKELMRRLDEKGLLKKDTGRKGTIKIMNSSGAEEMIERSEKLLKMPVD